jgi:hypothetical protein
VLVVRTETTLDEAQALLIGVYRYYRVDWRQAGPLLRLAAEGIFYADDLPGRDPEAMLLLVKYVRSHRPPVSRRDQDASLRIKLLGQREFMKRVLLPALSGQASVVGFNLPFDLSRLAVGYTAARGSFLGGFSFLLDRYEKNGESFENTHLPRIRWAALDSRRYRIGLTKSRPGSDPDRETRGTGAFLDCRTLANALTSEAHSLKSACDTFGIRYEQRQIAPGRVSSGLVDHCRNDVKAVALLYQALATEYEQWGLQRPPTRVYSPATLAKATLAEACIKGLLSRQPGIARELLGYAMAAYFGGRAECRIRRVPVPVAYLDFASMYLTVSSLQGLWRFHTCARLGARAEDPVKLERWLRRLKLTDPFEPKTWKKLNGLALVQPEGDILPVRARYSRGATYGIGVNPITSEQPLWCTIADLVAATILGGRPPKVLRVVRFTPAGRTSGLRPFRIRRSRPIDPYREDIPRALVEERHRHAKAGDDKTAGALKTVGLSLGYGIAMELNRQQPVRDPIPVRVYGLTEFPSETASVEEPGEYFNPPLGALVTAGARLMLAMLERLVSDAGGSYAFCDTDSMAIVATPTGGLIPCPGGTHRDSDGRESIKELSWQQIDEIRNRFTALNPYDQHLVPGSILRLENENIDPRTGERRQLYCYAISAKRYCLYTLSDQGQPELVKWSEHALGGFYINPLDPASDDAREWVKQEWRWLLHQAAFHSIPRPEWHHQPALSRFTASHPRLLLPFAKWNAGIPYQEQIKPANHLYVAHPSPGAHPRQTNPKRFALISPAAATNSPQQEWRNLHNPGGPTYRISTDSVIDRRGQPLPVHTVPVLTYGDLLNRYGQHPEPKSLGPDGQPCTRRTSGLLNRRPVHATTITHIGKESNLLDEIQAGLIGDEKEALVEYRPVGADHVWDEALGVIRALPLRPLARRAGIANSTLTELRAGRRQPSSRIRRLLVDAVDDLAVSEPNSRDPVSLPDGQPSEQPTSKLTA